MNIDNEMMHRLVTLCAITSPSTSQRQRIMRLSHMLARMLNVSPEHVLAEANDIVNDEACMNNVESFDVQFRDPLSEHVVYAMGVDARDVGDAYTRACAFASRRGINVNACAVRIERFS